MNSKWYKQPVITGIGITTASGQGKKSVTSSLLKGQTTFGIMQREGRQHASAFIGAELGMLLPSERISPKLFRSASLSGKAALITLAEAWEDALLDEVPPVRIGLIVGGSNVQQREALLVHEKYRDRQRFITPAYGISFMDTDICGLCTEQFGIRGHAYTLGAASASGQAAILQAVMAVESGQVDVCIALGALMDLSYWELQSLKSLGALGSERFANHPAHACRPYDTDRDGFIYGESCGAVVIESSASAKARGVRNYAVLNGGAMYMDGHRNPDPSFAGESYVISQALQQAGITAAKIDYINPHATGSRIGDETELAAIRHCKLEHAFINTTKSILGHGLTAAGCVELIAVLLQMETGMLHPSVNLDNPIDDNFNWVRQQAVAHQITHAITLSFGFGGMNTALVISAPQ